MNKINRIKELIKTLNVYRNEYYNNNNSLILFSGFCVDIMFPPF